MWWMVGVGLLAWLLMMITCDGPHIEAWQARNNFKIMNAVLVFLIVWMSVKSHGWHTELVALIPYCSP